MAGIARFGYTQPEQEFGMSEAWEDERFPTEEEYNDVDPVCVCGTARSEHALCGCPEGFQSPEAWAHVKAFIESLDEWEFERIYG